MSDSTTNSGTQNGGDISQREIDAFAQNAFKQSMSALNNADFDKTSKMFGIIEVPTGIVSVIDAFYNVGTKFAGDIVRPRVQSLAKKYGAKAGLEGNTLTQTAAAAAIGVDVAMKSGKYFGEVWDAHTARRKQFVKLAETIAPVLDEMTGRHTVGALTSITNNEVIVAHRKRLSKIANAKSTNTWIDLAVNASPNVLMDSKEWLGMWQGKSLKEIRAEALKKKIEAAQHGTDHSALGHYFNLFTNGMSAQVASYFKKLTDHNLNKGMQPYSALDMILELERQVAGKPNAHSFTLPKAFGSNKSGESCPLEEYVMRVIIQHEKDMAGFSPDHVEIREALKDDVAAVAKPLAEAIRKGEVSALELIHLVGEGKIILNHGRSIATADEVMAAARRLAPKQDTFVHVDPKVWEKSVSFKPKEGQAAIEALDAQDKPKLISMMPHEVRAGMGVNDDESKAVDALMAPQRDRVMADMIVGLASKPEEQAEREGLAKREYHQLEKANQVLEKKGLAGMAELKTSATNNQGVEPLLTNWAVTSIQGDKTSFGRLIQDGHAKMETLAARAANDAVAVKSSGHAEKLMSKQGHMEHANAANDRGESYAERVHEGRATGTHDHSYT